jgi:hypothetical protein
MFNFKKPPILKILLVLWLVFATLYVVYGEYNRLNFFVAQTAYNNGIRDSVAQIMVEASKCEQAIPLTIDTQTVEVISVECLNAQAPAENMNTPAPMPEQPVE